MICSGCDHGNIYCNQQCSQEARQKARRAAGRRYQNSHRGRRKHADRQRRYRERQREKVTHQGSPAEASDDLLPMTLNEPETSAMPITVSGIQCHFCGRRCTEFVRIDFMQPHLRHQTRTSPSWPLGP
jgi:hypothetical protein